MTSSNAETWLFVALAVVALVVWWIAGSAALDAARLLGP